MSNPNQNYGPQHPPSLRPPQSQGPGFYNVAHQHPGGVQPNLYPVHTSQIPAGLRFDHMPSHGHQVPLPVYGSHGGGVDGRRGTKAQRFIQRLKTELLPPRHPSATVAIPGNPEVKHKQVISLLRIFAHAELLETHRKKDVEDQELLEADDEELATNKQHATGTDLQAMLEEDDDGGYEPLPSQHHAQAEDDWSERSSNDDEIDKKNEENLLITEQDEKVNITRYYKQKVLKGTSKKSHKRMEKFKIDPEWMEQFSTKRQKLGDGDGEEKVVERAAEANLAGFKVEKSLKSFEDLPIADIQEELLYNYLISIKKFSLDLKVKMYIRVIRLYKISTFSEKNKRPANDELSPATKQILQFISNHDRESFFPVVKFWIHDKFAECESEEDPQFLVLFNHILVLIKSSGFSQYSSKWSSFILSLPCFPESLFKHVYQSAVNNIQKDVPAVKVLQKMLILPLFKISVKKQALKLLMKTTFSDNQASCQSALKVLIMAHSQGYFQEGKMDILKEYLHEFMDSTLAKFAGEKQSIKLNVYKQILFLIFSIAVDNTQPTAGSGENANNNLDGPVSNKVKFYYFDLVFKHYDSMEEETKNLLLKHYFYKLANSEKFKEVSSKPMLGPLTKEELRAGLKHPVKEEESPMCDLLKISLRNMSQREQGCLMEFITVLKTKAKLTADITHLLLEKSILIGGYEKVIKETFSTLLSSPAIKKQIKEAESSEDPDSVLCTLLIALLEQTKHLEDKNKNQVYGKQTTHSVIIKALLKLPTNKVAVFNRVCEHFNEYALVNVLGYIIDQSTEETIESVMEENTMFMRSILLNTSKTEIGTEPYVKIISEAIKKGVWKIKLQWNGVKMFIKCCRKQFTDDGALSCLPEELREELDTSQSKK